MNRPGQYKRFEKEVPFSIKPIQSPEEILEWRQSIEMKSKAKRQQTRDRTIAAWSQVQSNRKAYIEGTRQLPTKQVVVIKPNLLTRLINWFSNININ